MKKRYLAWLLALALLTGCGQRQTASQPQQEPENYATGDAALDDPRNQDGIGERELLVVSFGTSYNDSRRLTIGAIETTLAETFPEWSVRRGFTSDIIINHVAQRDGVEIDSVTQALDRAVANGVKTLVIQPTHLMDGFEYHDLMTLAHKYADSFQSLSLADPLLTGEDDFSLVADCVAQATKEYDDGKTAICFMGHGTEAASNAVYGKMQEVFAQKGLSNYYVATVESDPSLEDLVKAVKEKDYTRVVLEPLMIVAGDHAHNDMAGEDPESWKSVFEKEGYEVICLLRGLGELEPIRQILVQHARTAIEQVESNTSQVADAAQTVAAEQVVEETMTPISGSSLMDGVYPEELSSSSSMFRVESCELRVEQGQMTAVLTLNGSSYGYLYPGTAAQAAQAEQKDLIPAAEAGEGQYTFTAPVEALDAGLPFAAWSRKKELWYDRTLVFRADSLPLTAFRQETLTTARSLGLADGTYQVEVALSGGTGKAAVASPCTLRVEGGEATAEIVWSSPNYDYMVVNGETILTQVAEGHSVCQIPVAAFDHPLGVVADTTAMSQPHEIAYTLRFSSASLQKP